MLEVLIIGPIRQYGIIVLFGLLYLIERILGFWLLIPVRERGTRVGEKKIREIAVKSQKLGISIGGFERP